MIDDGANDMRRHNADETDGACQRDGCAGRQSRPEYNGNSLPPQIEPDAAGSFFTQCERRQSPASHEKYGKTRNNERQCDLQVFETSIGHRTQQPVDHVG